jgi:AraC-like DNA-binding protein
MDKKAVEDFIFGPNCRIAVHPPWDSLHRHDEIELSFFRTEKPVVFRIGGRVIELKGEDTLLFWGAMPHQIVDIARDVEQYWLTIPPAMFLRWDLPDALTQGILNGSVLTEHDEELRRMDIACFPVWMKEARDTANVQRRIALYRSFEARIRRFEGFSQSSVGFSKKIASAGGPPARANTAFLRMSDYITRNFKTNIHTEDIAEKAGLHPKYAISLFRKESGINITDFIMMLRVYAAQRLLLTSDMKIIDIAMDAGFESMSNFYKCFKKICGRKPKDYRKGLEF